MSDARVLICFATVLAAVSLVAAPARAQRSCASLSSLRLPHTTITLAKFVPAGPFTPPPSPFGPSRPVDLPAFCRVVGVIRPTSDSHIKFEVWMPAKGWNGRFQQLGNGGFAGSIVYSLMIPALRQGYATASTDDGHTGGGAPIWAIYHPQKVIDFGYRAVHLTAKDGEAIVRAFYSHRARWSYFVGCSDGGREALMEAQRFPDDFNGIIAGAPANSWTHLMAGFVWDEQATLDNPASYIPASKLPLIQAGALAACDALDGIKDGLIEDPRRCHFDPASLECKGPDGPDCLTAPQVEAVEKIYAGPKNPRTGKQIFPGYEPGAEAARADWPFWITGKAPGKGEQLFFGNGFFADMVFKNPKWNFRTFNFDSDVRFADAKLGPILNSANSNLLPFKARGGRLIQYHGWADSAIAPLSSVGYYESVVAVMRSHLPRGADALRETQSFYRLFMVPGMGHCGGGPGPDVLRTKAGSGLVTALRDWVEHDTAPDKIVGTKFVDDNPAKGVLRTRPVCPYPEEAKWTGKGNTNDAANFVCALPDASLLVR